MRNISHGFILLCAIAALVSSVAAIAGELPTEPLLRIENRAYVGNTDARGQWLALSTNVGAQIWDVKEGRLLRTLRYPQEGDVGKWATPSLSPDGKWVALKTSGSWDAGSSLYLFDRASGQLTLRANTSSGLGLLSWSPDGQWIAATTKTGILIFRSADLSIFGNDNFGEANTVNFSSAGMLAATTRSGEIRLYQVSPSGMRLITKANTNKDIMNGRFSPNGELFAIAGFANTKDDDAVQIFSMTDSTIRSLTSRAIPKYYNSNDGIIQAAISVAWSVDGKYLYASSQMIGSNVFWRWDMATDAPYTPLVASSQRSSYGDLTPLPDGRLAYDSGEGWGVLDATGKFGRFENSPALSFVNERESRSLHISSNGKRLAFAGVIFDLDKKELVALGNEVPADLHPPITTSTGINVTDWQYTKQIKLDGKPLALPDNTASLSLDIASDNSMFVVGHYKGSTVFDPQGKMIFNISSKGDGRFVGISSDRRLLVVASDNGIITWHRISDGKELLKLFVHSDRKRWVMWTPSGYYDASPGAEDLIGWHLNRGKDNAADFFPASRFRNQFNRPDVITKVLDIGSETEALRLANAEAGRKTQVASIIQVLPPVVEIVSPNEGAAVSTASITLKYSTRSPDDAPVTGLRARVNGLAVNLPDARNLTVTATGKPSAVGVREITVPIPPQDSEIQLFAENKNGVSTPATLRVNWAGKKAAPVEEDKRFKPKLYVLAVGVSKYKNPDYNLGLAAKDATDFAAVFGKQKGKLYGDVVVRLLTDDKASKDDVLDGLEWLKSQVTSRDVGVMFIAGHGMNDNIGNYYFLPYNVNPEQLMRTGVAQNDIKLTLNSLAGKAVFFVDTCHSGNALGSGKTRAIGGSTDAFVNELASAENGVIVFSSSTGRQLSQEDPKWGNGAFTKAVVEGLSGKAEIGKSGKITHKGLDYYVTERVKELTKGQQSPVSIAPGGITDFPIAVVGK